MFKFSDIVALLIVGAAFLLFWLFQSGRKISPSKPLTFLPLSQYWRRYWPAHSSTPANDKKLSVFESAIRGDLGHLPDEHGEETTKP